MAVLLPVALAWTIDLGAKLCRLGVGEPEEFNGLAVLVIVGRVDDLLGLLGGYLSVFPHCAEQMSDDSLGCRHFGQKAELNGGRLPVARHGDQRIAAPFPQ